MMPGKVKRRAYNVRWAEGRAIVSYATEGLAKKAARILHGTVSYGPARGRVRWSADLPKAPR